MQAYPNEPDTANPNAEPFQLQSPRVAPRRMKFESSDQSQQRTLFAGLDCLPGQADLFPTNGLPQIQ